MKHSSKRQVVRADAVRATAYDEGSLTIFLTNFSGKTKASAHFWPYQKHEIRALIAQLELYLNHR